MSRRTTVRRASVRRSVTLLACLAAVAGTAPLLALPATATAADAAPAPELVLDLPGKAEARREQVLATDHHGYTHRAIGSDAVVRTDWSTGVTTPVTHADGSPVTVTGGPCADVWAGCLPGWYGQAANGVAVPDGSEPKTVTVWHDGNRSTVDLAGGRYIGLYGVTVLTGGPDGTGAVLLAGKDGGQTPRTVTGVPDGARLQRGAQGDADGAAVVYQLADGTHGLGYVDFATAAFTTVFADLGTVSFSRPLPLLGPGGVGYAYGTGVKVRPRADLAAPARETTLVAAATTAALSGDWVVTQFAARGTTSLSATSLADGTRRVLLNSSHVGLAATPGAGLLVTGGTDGNDWWFKHVNPGPDGPVVYERAKIAPYAYPKTAMSLSRGTLRVAENDKGTDQHRTSVWNLTAAAGGTVTASARTDGRTAPAGAGLWGNSGTGGDVVLGRGTVDPEGAPADTDELQQLRENPNTSGHRLNWGTTGGRIVDVADGYAVYRSGGAAPAQYADRFGYQKTPAVKRTPGAAALNGPLLWSATTTPGRLTTYHLNTGKTATVDVPAASCVPTELQAAGRWLYWSCGTVTAGVYDTVARTTRTVTGGDVLLGDGFTVRHDEAADSLVLTDAVTGESRTLASGMPDGAAGEDRRRTWTVDEYTGLVAWNGSDERIRVKAVTLAPTALNVLDSDVDADIQLRGTYPTWHAVWTASRPVADWKLSLTDPAGTVLRTFTGGPSQGQLGSVYWDGRTTSGAHAPNGRFTWTLTATPLGAATPVRLASGTGTVRDGSAVRGDFGHAGGPPDGIGDAMGLTSGGTLRTIYGNSASGAWNGTTSSTGWAGGTRVVPFGDLTGDRCNDVLVRTPAGELRRYAPACGKQLTTGTAYKVLGPGWNQYDVLTSPGDVTGDKRPDLIARNPSTGALYLYPATSTGILGTRTLLAGTYKGYKRITGAGDLNGDGHGDLVLHDTGNELWRMNGLGGGKFAARVKLADDWGTAYNTLAGVGDLTGDGRPDLIARDTAGVVWRYAGTGKGTFGSRVRIATGWQVYSTVS
ncbi:FG-GAP-like repeat-containing protein [Streptomyces sp. NPDC101132]|uniref:FG-GAP-like repeat-containing protein n=1 Tax=Streptomyces sp. NPDC101132 TaxID=3366110 RepID=UPI0038244164